MAWNIDRAHSEIGFSVRHMMISTVRGKFNEFEADVTLDPEHLEAAEVTARIQAASVDTGEPKRDGHLRSGDFFDAEKFPTLTFTSTRPQVPRRRSRFISRAARVIACARSPT